MKPGPLILSVLMALSVEGFAGGRRAVAVGNAQGLGQRPSGSDVLVYLSTNDTLIANDLLQSFEWIPESVRNQFDGEVNHFLVAATRFSIQRDASTLGREKMLAVDDLENVCGCEVSSVSRPSANTVSFRSSATRSGITVRSNSYIRYFHPDRYSSLPIGSSFLSRHFGINASQAAFASYQVSWDFNRIFSTSQVISFFFPMAGGQVDVVSVSLSIYKPGANRLIRSVVKGQVEVDLLRVAREAERNGRH